MVAKLKNIMKIGSKEPCAFAFASVSRRAFSGQLAVPHAPISVLETTTVVAQC